MFYGCKTVTKVKKSYNAKTVCLQNHYQSQIFVENLYQHWLNEMVPVKNLLFSVPNKLSSTRSKIKLWKNLVPSSFFYIFNVFQGNIELCLKFGHTPGAIDKFVHLLAGKEKSVAYLQFLKITPSPQSQWSLFFNRDLQTDIAWLDTTIIVLLVLESQCVKHHRCMWMS